MIYSSTNTCVLCKQSVISIGNHCPFKITQNMFLKALFFFQKSYEYANLKKTTTTTYTIPPLFPVNQQFISKYFMTITFMLDFPVGFFHFLKDCSKTSVVQISSSDRSAHSIPPNSFDHFFLSLKSFYSNFHIYKCYHTLFNYKKPTSKTLAFPLAIPN